MGTPARIEKRLSPKLEAVVARLSQKVGPLTTTRAVKLPYLVDVVANHFLGGPITEGTHETWDYGVVTTEVWSYVQGGGGRQGPLAVEESRFTEGGRQISLAGAPFGGLTPEEEEIVDHVAATYGSLDAASLGRLTKTLNTQFDARAWGKNHRASIDDDAYARLSDGYQAFARHLPDLDLSDESQWGEPIQDPREYLRRKLGG